MADEEEHVEETLGDYGIRLSRPEWWDRRVEEGNPPTWLFWDEFTGSLRLTPWRVESPGFRVETFLEARMEGERAKGHAPEWKQVGGRRWLVWTQDDAESGTRSHFHVTGEGDLVLVCSWAYDKAMLDDELEAGELDSATEEATRCIESVRFG